MSHPQEVWTKRANTPAEASYNAGVATASLTIWDKHTEPGLLQQQFERITDENVIQGYYGKSDAAPKVISERVEGQLQGNLDVDNTPFYLALVSGGAVASGGPTDYSHVMKHPAITVSSPPSTSLLQGTDRSGGGTASQFQFDGIVVRKVDITIPENGIITRSYDVAGSGKATAKTGETPPAVGSAAAGDELCTPNITTIGLGPAAEDISSIFLSGSLSLDAGLTEKVEAGGGLHLGGWSYPNDGPVLTAELRLRGVRGDTVWNYAKNNTKLQFDLVIEETAVRSLEFAGNGVYASVEEDFDDHGSVLVVSLSFGRVAADSSPYIITALNQTALYL